jgi:hypothetical protein
MVGALALRPGKVAGKSASDIGNIKMIIEIFLRST